MRSPQSFTFLYPNAWWKSLPRCLGAAEIELTTTLLKQLHILQHFPFVANTTIHLVTRSRNLGNTLKFLFLPYFLYLISKFWWFYYLNISSSVLFSHICNYCSGAESIIALLDRPNTFQIQLLVSILNCCHKSDLSKMQFVHITVLSKVFQ